ncbi:UvrD-helicase domain-containing protein [Actinoplanes missouriensis]|uniref:UvrD-helicase domain-containing protein n=1 Tax=Actinoplanes missouriensis TaxID=1866 RepID=UPI0036BEB432
MSDASADALRVREAMPCSVTMPAGTGKTEIIAWLALHAADRDERALILTHTHAGVDALRQRLKAMRVPLDRVRIETIASWSHVLVRQYPVLAGVTVPAVPDWSNSGLYYEGAARVVAAPVMQRVLAATYAFAVVDEYQDCSQRQHALAVAVGAALPVAVFGDPLQAIFGFEADDPLPSWHGEVETRWPARAVAAFPWRWRGHHSRLGEWLLEIREHFDAQEPIRLDGSAPVHWIPATGPGTAIQACYGLRSRYPEDSVVAIGLQPHDCVAIAGRLGGSYSLMETIEGRDMVAFAHVVDGRVGSRIAAATAKWAKGCITGISKLVQSDDVKKLASGKSTTHLKRPGAEAAHKCLSRLLIDPSPAAVHAALLAIGEIGGSVYRRDAWYTVLNALRSTNSGGLPVAEAVTRYRNRTRATGRRDGRYMVSRPMLIKGLEYDHAIVLDAGQHDPTSLYVALTRARRSLTIISDAPLLQTAQLAGVGPGWDRRRR